MAMVNVRQASIYVGGKRWAQVNTTGYSINSGDEPQYDDNGFAGMSRGATTTELNADSIVPVNGMDVDVYDAIVNKRDIDVLISLVNGRTHQVTMRCTTAETKGDAKAGTLNGSFKFMGGKPRIV